MIFHRTLRTRLTAQCTESDLPTHPKPALVRSENQKPLPSAIMERVGGNTFIDNRQRLVHDADKFIVPDPESSPDAVPEIREAPPEGPEVATGPRRSERIRSKPIRYGFDN